MALLGIPGARHPARVPGRARRQREQGAFAIMFVPLLFVMLGMCGLALDLGMVYNRKAELHGLAKTVALAAARELNGRAAGIDAALNKGREAALRFKVGYRMPVTWNDNAISFSTTPAPGAEWVSAAAARATPAARFYVKVDTAELAQETGLVRALWMQVLSQSLATASIRERAVAGRTTTNVLPLAVCAMSPVPGAARANAGGPPELVQYGYRRGLAYDLMQLNPGGTAPANYVVDPVSPPGGLGAAGNTTPGAVAPFICKGAMWVPRVTGGPIRVSSPFPLDALYRELNSRFDDYGAGSCDPNGAPPDYNIKAYAYDAAKGVVWMNPKPTRQGAASHAEGGRLQTIADLPAPPAGTAAGMYGPLWSYARAVRFSAYQEGEPEPAAGYARFSPSDWGKLYPPGPGSVGFPSPAPYQLSSGDTYKSPAAARADISALDRRLLHVPLLSCPVSAGTNVGATAVAIGKFFMTVPATATSLVAEFAGIANETTLAGQVVLYP
ncbi:pilus assembly protein TadG-related protein [Massilia niastensis]|uniref:pilus assembly protein TadG-related protein n=1 Tax=Massilia niastensis TaxID=544911 RepID=UPI00037ED546|nr:pilus assembly protein TadG-related protein [Massilia niastensis]